MTILTDIPIDEPTKVSALDKRGRIQAITIGGQTINAAELEPLSKQLHNPEFQEQMRSAFGIPRHRKPTMLERMIGILRRPSSN